MVQPPPPELSHFLFLSYNPCEPIAIFKLAYHIFGCADARD